MAMPSDTPTMTTTSGPETSGAAPARNGGADRSVVDEERDATTAGHSGQDLDGEKTELDGATLGNPDREDFSGDDNVVWWDGPDDPENPYNWPTWRKSVNCGLVSAMTFISPLASSIFAPAVPLVMEEFGSTSYVKETLVVSVYVLGLAAGPLVFAPASEMYGRVVMYHTTNLAFLAFTIGCALAPSLDTLIAFRFLCGLFGSSSVTNGGGTIADIITQERRGLVMSMYIVGPILGPIVGPIAGGFLAGAAGWRWVFWLLAIVIGVVSIAMLFMAESYAPILIQRRTARRQKETGNNLLRSKFDIGLSPAQYFKRSILRPIKMLLFSPIAAIMSFYVAVSYGFLYLYFTTFTSVFMSTYGFTTETVGLSFLGLGVGSAIALGYLSGNSDKYMKKKTAEAKADTTSTDTAPQGMKPEYRLRLLPLGALFIPVGLFIYGWTAEYKIHWIVPIIGTAIIGAGNLTVLITIQLYLVDSFTIYAASAMATNIVIRSIAGALLPLAGLPLYDKLGLGWGNSLLAFIALILVPVAMAIVKYGEGLRKRFDIKEL